MTVLIIGVLAAAWVAVTVLVVSLCASAAHGDAALREPAEEVGAFDRTRTARFGGFSASDERHLPAA